MISSSYLLGFHEGWCFKKKKELRLYCQRNKLGFTKKKVASIIKKNEFSKWKWRLKFGKLNEVNLHVTGSYCVWFSVFFVSETLGQRKLRIKPGWVHFWSDWHAAVYVNVKVIF